MELIRILRERLSDTQINLRPLAARVVGLVLSSVDKCSQAKIGKIVYTALINSAMNDIKKPVRDASLEAIRQGITVSSLDGDGLNDLGMEGLVGALVEEVNESSIRVRLYYINSVFVFSFSHTFAPGGWIARNSTPFAVICK
jgi:hypothetical protein